MTAVNPSALDALEHELLKHRYRYANEADLQRQIGLVLRELGGDTFKAEHTLSKIDARRDRPDFFHSPTGIAIEIKTQFSGGSPAQVKRQLERYAAHDEVNAILLASTSHRIALCVPPEMNGKPVRRVALIMDALA